LFSFGKKKLYLGQVSRIIATTLLGQEKIDYGNVDEFSKIFNENEIEYINNELFLLRFTSLSFSFAVIALEKRLNISSFDIGNIISQGTKLAFQDVGYIEQHIEFLGNKFSNDITIISNSLENVPFNREIYITTIALGFTDNFFTSLGYENVDELKRNSLFVCATSVVSMVFEIVDEFLKKVKIIDFK